MGKNVALYGKKTKTESRDERERELIPKNVPRAQVPFSVKKTSFRASYAGSAGKKNNCFFLFSPNLLLTKTF